jgi:Tol biopolymer transport system component
MKRIVSAAAASTLAAGLSLALLPTESRSQSAKATKIPLVHAGHIQYPQFSPDGTQIAYEVLYPDEKRTELWMAGWDGSKVTSGPTKLVPESMASSGRYGAAKRITHGFAWARTGPYAYAYSVSDSTGAQDIYVDNWSTMIGEGDSANKNPDWDPKESRFIFSSGRTGNGDLYLWDPNNPSVTQMTYDATNAEIYPVFSPGGDKVAYVRAGKGGSHLFMLDINVFSSVALVQWEGKESTRPSFSPDGSKIAFFSNKATTSVSEWGLWVTDSRAGGTPRNIGPLVHLPSKGAAQWTPDGKGVIAVANAPDQGDPLCIYPVDGGSPNCLTGVGTRVNRDPDFRVIDGAWKLLYTAQQRLGDNESTWHELYVYDVPH